MSLISLKPYYCGKLTGVRVSPVSYFQSSVRSGNMANIGDLNDSTYWTAFYDAGEYVGYNISTTSISKVRCVLYHPSGTYLQAYYGAAWNNIATISGSWSIQTVSYQVALTGVSRLRLASAAGDNKVGFGVYELTAWS